MLNPLESLHMKDIVNLRLHLNKTIIKKALRIIQINWLQNKKLTFKCIFRLDFGTNYFYLIANIFTITLYEQLIYWFILIVRYRSWVIKSKPVGDKYMGIITGVCFISRIIENDRVFALSTKQYIPDVYYNSTFFK